MMATGIPYVSETWEPVSGCPPDQANEKCRLRCWAAELARRLPHTHAGWDAAGLPIPFSQITLHSDRLDQPMHWRKSRVVLVASRGDLFHEQVRDEYIDRVFSIILAREILTRFAGHKPIIPDLWLILTKRAERLRSYLSAGPEVLLPRWAEAGDKLVDMRAMWRTQFGAAIKCGVVSFAEYVHGQCAYQRNAEGLCVDMHTESWKHTERYWPLPNVWLGVSITCQTDADERIPVLLDTPAAHRWISYEPALGPLDLDSEAADGLHALGCGDSGHDGHMDYPECQGLNWVVAGCESGPGARHTPCKWLRDVQAQCVEAGIPSYVKQCSGEPGEQPVIRFAPEPGELPWTPRKKAR